MAQVSQHAKQLRLICLIFTTLQGGNLSFQLAHCSANLAKSKYNEINEHLSCHGSCSDNYYERELQWQISSTVILGFSWKR